MIRMASLRFILILLFVLVMFGILLLGVTLTDSLLSLIDRLEHFPRWLNVFLLGVLSVFSIMVGALVFWLLQFGKRHKKTVEAPATAEDLRVRLEQAEADGVDVSQAKLELEYLQTRQTTGHIYIALFGEISSGKSSLIKALLPDQDVHVSVVGGSTRTIEQYGWKSPAGDQLIFIDMPGLAESMGELDDVSRDEALRAHLVIYVCDGDLTRQQLDELKVLFKLDKPLVIALNKVDRMNLNERDLVMQCIEEKTSTLGCSSLVSMSTGGLREVTIILPNGDEVCESREIKPQLAELQMVIQQALDQQAEVLNTLQDSSVFVLVNQHLDKAVIAKRKEQSQKIVESYTRRAVMGAMAAMAPGTDLVIQGYLASRLVSELANLHDVKVREIEINQLIQLVQKHVGKTHTLMLAIAGNALKSFPGAGTVAGGALHAIAYGILFDSFGRAVSASLESRGALHPMQTAQQFKESLGENLEWSARSLAKMVITAAKEKG